MSKYTAVQIGLGARGIIHLDGMFNNSERFEVVGICDRHPEKVSKAATDYAVSKDKLFYDAERMVKQLLPDVLSFATLPHIRLELVELAAKYGVKGLMFEKPMATSLAEAGEILEICQKNNIKAIICHQHKYLQSFRKLDSVLKSGELGEIFKIDAATQAHLAHQGTHYMDYILWANQGIGAESVVGHIHGKDMLNDDHPSPDYVMGEVVMKNGIRANLQCGYMTRPKVEHADDYRNKKFPIEYWTDARLTVYGSTGYAFAECNGRWAVFSKNSKGQVISGQEKGFFDVHLDAQAEYTKDFANWLDDDTKVHPSNLDQAYHGMEILEGVYLSALENRRVDLPLAGAAQADMLERMAQILPDVERRIYPVQKV